MRKIRSHKLRRLAKQLGQGMTEYIIIVAVIAIGSIAVYSLFGDTLRQQTAAAAATLAGGDGTARTTAAVTAATKAGEDAQTQRDLDDFAANRGH